MAIEEISERNVFSKILRPLRQMIILPPESIPPKDHQPDRDRGEDGDDDDPDDGVIDVFFPRRINILDGPVYQLINNEGCY